MKTFTLPKFTFSPLQNMPVFRFQNPCFQFKDFWVAFICAFFMLAPQICNAQEGSIIVDGTTHMYDTIIYHNTDITADVRWTENVPGTYKKILHYVNGDIAVKNGAKLTIAGDALVNIMSPVTVEAQSYMIFALNSALVAYSTITVEKFGTLSMFFTTVESNGRAINIKGSLSCENSKIIDGIFKFTDGDEILSMAVLSDSELKNTDLINDHLLYPIDIDDCTFTQSKLEMAAAPLLSMDNCVLSGASITGSLCSEIKNCEFKDSSVFNVEVVYSEIAIEGCSFDNSDVIIVNNWDGTLETNEPKDTLKLKNCTFKKSYSKLSCGFVELFACRFMMDSCSINEVNSVLSIYGGEGSISDCSVTYAPVGGFYFANGDYTVSYCESHVNNGNGIMIGDNANVSFEDCLISENKRAGIYFYQAGTDTATHVSLERCSIYDNTGDGIYGERLGGEASLSLDSVILRNNNHGLNCLIENISVNKLYLKENDTTAMRLIPNAVNNLDVAQIHFSNNQYNGVEIETYDYGLDKDAVWQGLNDSACYYMDGTLYVNAGWHLYSDLYFGKDAQLFIAGEGYLKASSVQFKPDDDGATYEKGYWGGILFRNCDSASVLDNCKVEHAGGSSINVGRLASIAVDWLTYGPKGNVTLNNCTIKNGGGDGIYVNGNSGDHSYLNDTCRLQLSGCVISENDSCGIYIDEYTFPVIENCTISKNGGYGIFTNYLYSGGTLNGGEISSNAGGTARLPVNMVGGIGSMEIFDNKNNNLIEIWGGRMMDDATWVEGYGYNIKGRTELIEGHLTIEKGVKLLVDKNFQICVRTSITAIGTEGKPIVFTSSTEGAEEPGLWAGLYFTDVYGTSEPSTFKHCNTYYAGRSYDDGAFDIMETDVAFSDCEIAYGGSAGIYVIDGAKVSIDSCEIHHNGGTGINAPWEWEDNGFSISNTDIHDNGSYAIQGIVSTIKNIKENVNIYSNNKDAINILGGQEPKSGDSYTGDGHWGNHNVPYHINGYITVGDNEKLEIEEGNKFYFNTPSSISVLGTLDARGDSASVISFLNNPDEIDYWDAIIFDSPDETSHLQYCKFSNGGQHNETATGCLCLNNTGGKVSFQNCEISDSYSNGLCLTNNSTPGLNNCTIINNSNDGIYADSVGINNPVFGESLAGWNDIYGNGVYNINNANTSSLTAPYVYWGTIEQEPIEVNVNNVQFEPWTNAAHDSLYPQSPINPQQYVVTTTSHPEIGGTTNRGGTYNSGTEITVTAKPATGYVFVNWTEGGEVVSADTAYTFTVTGNHDLTANFEIINIITVFISPQEAEDAGCAVSGGGTYKDGTTATLTATAVDGWIFTGWTGDTTTTENPLEVTIDSDKSITACFTCTNEISVSVSNEASDNGCSVKKETDPENEYNRILTAITDNTKSSAVSGEWAFIRWEGDVPAGSEYDNPLVVSILGGDKNITAMFARTYALTTGVEPQNAYEGGCSVSQSGSSSKQVSSMGNGAYYEGETATLTATPAEGWIFTGWTGGITSTENPVNVNIESDKEITSNFEQKSYSLALSISPEDAENAGCSAIQSGNGTYIHGEKATLTATPAEGWIFTGWTGGITSTENPVSVNIESDKEITSNFEQKSYSLALSISPEDAENAGCTANQSGNGTYIHGEKATLTATPAEGWIFTGWTGGITSTENPVSATIDSYKEIIAAFEIKTVTENDIDKEGFLFYPNPVSGILTIELPESAKKHHLKIIDITGKIIMENVNFCEGQINFSNWEKGIYLLYLQNNDNTYKEIILKD